MCVCVSVCVCVPIEGATTLSFSSQHNIVCSYAGVMTFSITTSSIMDLIVTLSQKTLSIMTLYICISRYCGEYHYAECRIFL
jgi:hypothetical protein